MTLFGATFCMQNVRSPANVTLRAVCEGRDNDVSIRGEKHTSAKCLRCRTVMCYVFNSSCSKDIPKCVNLHLQSTARFCNSGLSSKCCTVLQHKPRPLTRRRFTRFNTISLKKTTNGFFTFKVINGLECKVIYRLLKDRLSFPGHCCVSFRSFPWKPLILVV